MCTAIRSAFLSSLLALSLSASPTAVVGPLSIADSPTDHDLSDNDTPPWGPDAFDCRQVAQGSRFHHPLDTYMFAINFASRQALQDFNGHLPRELYLYKDDDYPDIFLGVRSKDWGHFIPRRYVLWGLTRIMHGMPEDEIMCGTYELRWRDEEVGRIVFTEGPMAQAQASYLGFKPEQNLIQQMTQTQDPPSTDVTNDSIPTVDNSAITWDFKFRSNQMTQADIFMGTIGALIGAAEHTDHNFDIFAEGMIPTYKALCVYNAVRRPSDFSKPRLIKTLVAAAKHARQNMNFHELRVTVNDTQGVIASGGIMEFSMPPDLYAVLDMATRVVLPVSASPPEATS